MSIDGLALDCGCREHYINLSFPHPLKSKKLFSNELVGAFGCDISLSLSVNGSDL
jgi:hypothetical protein